MSTSNTPRRRRTIDDERMQYRVNVALDGPTGERLEALSVRYNVSRGAIARRAIQAGLKAAAEALRRSARRDGRDRHGSGHAPEANA